MKDTKATLGVVILVLIALFVNFPKIVKAQVKIGDNPSVIDPSAVLEVEKTDKGILIPRMTKAQRNKIKSPAKGLLIFQTDGKPGLYFYNGTRWSGVSEGSGIYSGDGKAPADLDIAVTDNVDFDNSTLFIDGANDRIGIGTNKPNAPLQLSNSVGNRKVVMYESKNNDHQYYGFGINSSTLRYQVDGTHSKHAFYAGSGATSSNELMRIQGDGKVGIGTGSPSNKLDVKGWVTFGDQTEKGSNVEGTMRYNSTKKGMEFFDGTAWRNVGGGEGPKVQTHRLHDGVDEYVKTMPYSGGLFTNYSYSNVVHWNAHGIGDKRGFTVNDCVAGREILFIVEMVVSSKKPRINRAHKCISRISGPGIYQEKEVPLPGGSDNYTYIMRGKPNASGNLTFYYDCNTVVSNMIITTVIL